MINYSEFVTFVCREPGYKGHKELINTFPVMENSETYEKRLQTALNWAESYTREKIEITVIKKIPNMFKKGTVRIFDIDTRGNGGRAWKIAVTYKNKEYVLDLREDILLEILNKYGVDKGGIIQADLVLIFTNGYKVIVADKNKVEALKESDNKQRNLKKIPLNKLIPYHVYSSKTKEAVYLGRYYTISLKDILDGNLKCQPALFTIPYYETDDYMSARDNSVEAFKSLTVYTEKSKAKYLLNASKSEEMLFLADIVDRCNEGCGRGIIYNVMYALKTDPLKETHYLSFNKELSLDEAIKVLKQLKEILKEHFENTYTFINTNGQRILKDASELVDKKLSEYKVMQRASNIN